MDYIIYEFKISDIQEAQDWINVKGKMGYRIVDFHYYNNFVRYTLERPGLGK